jgi:hypothetical protein
MYERRERVYEKMVQWNLSSMIAFELPFLRFFFLSSITEIQPRAQYKIRENKKMTQLSVYFHYVIIMICFVLDNVEKKIT